MTAVQTQESVPAAPVNQHLRAAVQIVAEARERYAAVKANIATASMLFQEQWKEQFAELDQAKAAAETAEAQLRTLAEAHYGLTQEKHPVPGVEIKLSTEVTITDPKAAFAYAKQVGLCIALDEKGYKALAKTNDVPGATVSEVPKASISKDLSAAVVGGVL